MGPGSTITGPAIKKTIAATVAPEGAEALQPDALAPACLNSNRPDFPPSLFPCLFLFNDIHMHNNKLPDVKPQPPAERNRPVFLQCPGSTNLLVIRFFPHHKPAQKPCEY